MKIYTHHPLIEVDTRFDGEERNPVRRRCLECGHSFFLEFVCGTKAKCTHCGSTATPMKPGRHFVEKVDLKFIIDDY